MEKIQILIICQACSGQAYVPVGEEVNPTGAKYIRHSPALRARPAYNRLCSRSFSFS